MPFSRESFWPRDGTRVPYVYCTGRQVLYQYHHLGSPSPVQTWTTTNLFYVSIYFKKQVWLASVSLSFSTLAQQSEGKTVHAQTRLFQSLHTPHPLLMHGILPAKVYLCFPPTHPHSDKCPHHHFISAALLRKSPLEEKKKNWMRYHQTQFTSHVGVFTNTTCLEVCKHWRFARKLETRGCTSE